MIRLRRVLSDLRKRLRKLDSAVAEVEDLIERDLYQKKTGKPAPPASRGTAGTDRRKRTP
ncbi:MAG TPA: hypothetical protein VG273_24310 [Bryobacteraceae bacterium]|nr:hypothetical protein [Bryobacteraceae bacterium]